MKKANGYQKTDNLYISNSEFHQSTSPNSAMFCWDSVLEIITTFNQNKYPLLRLETINWLCESSSLNRIAHSKVRLRLSKLYHLD